MKNKKILNFLLPGMEKVKKSNFEMLNNLKQEKIIRISFLLIVSKYKLEILKNIYF